MDTVKKAAPYSPVSISHIEIVRRRIAVALRGALPAILIVAHLAFPIPLRAEGFGPFPVRNFNPLDQLVLNMPGDRASVVKKGTLDIRLEVANTAVIYREENPQASATVKFETLRSGLFLRYGVHDRFEIAVEIPGYYRYQGFMDGPIKTVERLTTGLSPARSALGDTSYAYNISRGGQTVVSGREGAAGLGDTTLMSKYQVLPETSVWPALSIRTAIKLPTGNEGEFFGSGSPDFGIGLASEKSLGGRWILYANLNGVFPTGRIGGMPLQPTFTGIAAAEYLWTEALSLTIQFDYYSPPFHGIGLRTLDRGVTEVAAGFGYRMASHWLWQLYAIENVDFITGSAPDFTVSTLITYRFGLWSD